MATENINKKDKKKNDSALKPDPETLHKTDPQENMKGPVSSVMQNIKEQAEQNEERDEQDEKKKDEKE